MNLLQFQEPCSRGCLPPSGSLGQRRRTTPSSKLTLSTEKRHGRTESSLPSHDDAGNITYIMESLRMYQGQDLERTLEETRESWRRSSRARRAPLVAADLDGNIPDHESSGLKSTSIFPQRNEREEKRGRSVPPGKAKELMWEMRKGKRGGKGKLPLTKVSILKRQRGSDPCGVTASIIYEQGKEVATMGILQ